MNKTLFGLALLSYNWDNNKKDIIDSYIPLLCNCIKNKTHNKIHREQIQLDLNEFYGINIPLGAIETILKRMTKDHLLVKTQTGEYSVNNTEILKVVNNSRKDDLDIGFKTLVIDLIGFSQNTFGISFSNEEIEIGLIAFFKENDLDLLFATNNDGVLPIVKESKKAKYIISKYITSLQFEEPAKFAMVVKLAKGYAIASLITYDNLKSYSGNLKDVEIYLDAPIIFNLLGLNGDSNLKLSKELIDALKENGANLKLFEVNYGEVIKTIQDAVNRLNAKNYDIAKSSRILRTSIRENISAQQLLLKLNQIDSMLSNFSILKTISPSLSASEYKFQIDETKLTKTIEDIYTNNEPHKIPGYKANQIERDVESISNIFKIRKRTQATSLKTSKAILLTSNESIAYAAKRYEYSDWEWKSSIPVCITDIFLSTILWANYPTKNDNLNIKQLISECYNIIELDNRLLRKFYDDIDKLHRENTLTDEQFFLLSSSNLTYTLLEEKTLNDIEDYTDKTPNEILENLHLKLNTNLNAEKDKLSLIDNNIRKFSKFLSKSVFYLIAIFLITASLFLKAKNPHLGGDWVNIFCWVLAGIIGIFGFLRWMDFIPTKTTIESTIENFIFNIIKNFLNK